MSLQGLIRRRASAIEVIALALVGVAVWRLLLGWDWSTVDRHGNEPGPFSDTAANTWHAIVVCAVAAAALLYLSLRGRPVLGSVAIGVPLVALSGWRMAAARTPDASFWPVGLGVIVVLAALGCAVVAAVASMIRTLSTRGGSMPADRIDT